MKIKIYCIFAKESVVKMNGIRGKIATQSGHAYLHSYWDTDTYQIENEFYINKDIHFLDKNPL